MMRSLSLHFGRFWPARISKKQPASKPEEAGKGQSGLLPTVLIRPATKKDYEQICELYEELDSFHRLARPDLFNRPEAPPRRRATIEALIKGDATTILVAEDPQSPRLLGFAVLIIRDLPASSVCLARRFVELDKLAVRAEARGAGVGRKIVEQAFAWAAERGFDCVEVAVHEFNSGAIGFYETMGFETVIRRMMMRLSRAEDAH
jgi:ribosomal protein S18 acetylase RimI-like enzyme